MPRDEQVELGQIRISGARKIVSASRHALSLLFDSLLKCGFCAASMCSEQDNVPNEGAGRDAHAYAKWNGRCTYH